MRILLVNEARRGGGGVETYLASLAEALRDAGHAVALLYVNPASQSGPTTIDTAEAWSIDDLGLDAALAAAVRWQPDVAFSHNMRRLDVDAALAARLPLVKMMHGYFGTCVSGQKAFSWPDVRPCDRLCGVACLALYVPRHCGALRPGAIPVQYAWNARQRDLFPHYRQIVVASEHMRREYVVHGMPPERVHAVPLFTAGDGIAAAEAGRFDVLFLGRMTPLKGADVLVEACERASRRIGRRVSLVMAGEGPLRDRLSHGHAAVSVEAPGWVDDSTRAELLSRANVLAVPSRWPEPFGLVGLEAAAAGVPAVAFDVGGISSWLTDHVNGLLVPQDAGASGFGDALARVLGDGHERDRLSAGARAAAARFTVAAHVATLEAVLEEARRP